MEGIVATDYQREARVVVEKQPGIGWPVAIDAIDIAYVVIMYAVDVVMG